MTTPFRSLPNTFLAKYDGAQKRCPLNSGWDLNMVLLLLPPLPHALQLGCFVDKSRFAFSIESEH